MDITHMFLYNQLSEGGSELAKALEVPRIKHVGSKFRGNPNKTLINWGASSERFPTDFLKCKVLNTPDKVDIAVDKVKSFNAFNDAGVAIPSYTTSKSTAVAWLEGGSMVFARTQLRAHSGRGIVIMDPEHGDTWDVNAPLYVKYVPKKYEYRIHVMGGQVIDTQRKGLKEEFQGNENVNFKVRNLANGFIYVRNDGHVVPEIVKSVGVAAVTALGLDFGAADVIFNQKEGQAYALEVNCAPGLTGTTITNYAEAFKAL